MHEAGRLAVPSVEADGLVRYRYGEGLATVVCAPFHLCSIELEDGEALTSQPATDKSWEAEPFAGVIDGRLHSTVNVHPKTSNIESTLFFYTDRRTYTLRLLPRQHEYMPRIAFSYADQHMNLWAQYRAKVAELKLFTPPPDPPAPPKIETWTLGYRIHGKKVGWPKKHEQHPPFWPRSVKDNGSRIFIQLPDAIAHTRSPLFMRVGPKGLEQVDFHPDGLCYTVDVLIDHLALVSDQGKHQQVVYIDSPRLP